MNAIDIGTEHEALAANYLLQAGLQILHRNFRSKLGEIDIIARDRMYLVFIEVRYRKNEIFGNAAESVNLTKQQKIVRTAQFYLQTHTWAQQLNCRFDVIAISNSTKISQISQISQIEWIKDAFNA